MSQPTDSGPTPAYYQDEFVTLHHGDCLEVMRTLPDNSVDAIVTDPPYSLAFMSKNWDRHDSPQDFQHWCQQWATEGLRVLKPGGHLLAFGGTRTWHRLTVAIEDAGFDIRDSIAWLYGSGFPKSLDVSKAIDKAAGATRDREPRVGGALNSGTANGSAGSSPDSLGALLGGTQQSATPATPEAATWQGWGTALKPAFEPVCVARKPLSGTVAVNVQRYGTGALNINATRVGTSGRPLRVKTGETSPGSSFDTAHSVALGETADTLGRWPANVALDASQATELDQQSGISRDGTAVNRNRTADNDKGTYSAYNLGQDHGNDIGYGGTGGASRFFPTFRYQAKAPTLERPRVASETGGDTATSIYDGKKLRECRACGSRAKPGNYLRGDPRPWPSCGHDDWSMVDMQPPTGEFVAHPTVKPLDLMRWLVRLVTPPGGTVLEPFAGSGTTAEACVIEGFKCLAIEREETYLPLIVARLSKPIQPDLFGGRT